MEQEVIADIARRIKKTGKYTETAELMAKSMREQGYSTDKIQAEVMKMLRADKEYQKVVAENTKAYKQEIQDIINETVKTAKENGNKLVAEAGNMAWNNDVSMWEQHGVDLKKPNDMSQLMDAFKKQTVGQLRNITKTTGFKNTVLGTTGVMQAYQREMDLAVLKVASGTFSFDQAVNDCVKRLAQSGLRSIDYANGRSYQLDTAARMCVRTGMSQLSGKITEMNLQATGQDLVRTSQHMGSRPEHAPWQNKVFSYSGKSKKYPDFFLETGYGTVEGLKGVNCTHDFYPYWEGDYIPPDVEPNEEYFKNTQKQRAMERNIRATKREIEAQKAIGGDVAALNSKLRKQVAEYHAFSEKVDIRPKDNRLSVISRTSNLSSKNKNKLVYVDKKIDLGYIKDIKLAHKVNKTSVDEEDINIIKKTISDLSKIYSIKLDVLEIAEYTDKEHIDAPLFYRATDDNGIFENVFVINNACDFWKNKEIQQNVYDSNFYAGKSLEDFVLHELAHLLTFQRCNSMVEAEELSEILEPLYTNGVSAYSWNVKDGSETIAESFVRIKQKRKVNKNALELVNKYIEVWKK